MKVKLIKIKVTAEEITFPMNVEIFYAQNEQFHYTPINVTADT